MLRDGLGGYGSGLKHVYPPNSLLEKASASSDTRDISSKPRDTYMDMKVNLAITNNLQIKTSTNIAEQLMVCSHERSGTHFMMNSIDAVSDYCSNPWLNYDLSPVGAKINFFSPASTHDFIKEMSDLKFNSTSTCNASIIKSHFPISHLGDEASKLPLKIIYVWRDPAETIASLWKYMHRWGWNEGPKTETPIELANSRPSGQSQRYQASNYKDYFERWAAHVIDGITHCRKNHKAASVFYEHLLKNHTSTTKTLCSELDIQMLQQPVIPSKTQNVIKGATLQIDEDTMERLRDLCDKRLEEFPELSLELKNAKH